MPTPLPTRFQFDSPDFDADAYVQMRRQQINDQERHDFIMSHAAGSKPNAVTDFVTNLPKNVTVGVMDAAINAIRMIGEGADAGVKGRKQVDENAASAPGGDVLGLNSGSGTPQSRREMSLASDNPPSATDPFVKASGAVLAFRDHMAHGSNTADEVTQGAAQFAIPFMGWSKLLGGLKGATALGTVARTALAESATASTALDPHAGRVADIAAMGRTVEGKLGDALRATSPDGSLMNSYIDYMTDRSDESAAEGRFKNVVDSLGVSAATAGLFKLGAKTIKQGGSVARALAKSPDTGAAFDIVPGKNGFAVHINGEPTLSFNTVDEAEAVVKELGGTPPPRKGADAAGGQVGVDTIDQQPIGNGKLSMQPSDNGFTVYAGKRPMLEFTNEKDAQAAIADFHQSYGQEAAMRIEANRAAASDKNFATLHSFTRVLQGNVKRPVSTHSLIDALERNLKGDTEEGAFYKEVLGRLRDKKIAGDTIVTGEKHPENRGVYDPVFGEIKLHAAAFDSPAKTLHTFTHEAVHAATMREMHESPRVYERIDKIARAASRAHDERVAAHAVKGNPDVSKALATARSVPKPYGFTNPWEFVAEIESNPQFRADMKKTVASDGESAWDKYLKAIAGILGLGSLAANPEFGKMMDPKVDTQTDGENPGA